MRAIKNRKLVERQTTKKGSKVDIQSLDAEELKANLEEKLGTELAWDDYSWTARGDFAGCEVVLSFTENDKGNEYEISYSKEGSIHNRSVWKGNDINAFEADVDAMISELGDYGEAGSDEGSEGTESSDEGYDDEYGEDDFESEEDTEESNGEQELDFDDFEESVSKRNKKALKEAEDLLVDSFVGMGPLTGITNLAQLTNTYGDLTLGDFFGEVLGLDISVQEDFLEYDTVISDLNVTVADAGIVELRDFLTDQGLIEY